MQNEPQSLLPTFSFGILFIGNFPQNMGVYNEKQSDMSHQDLRTMENVTKAE